MGGSGTMSVSSSDMDSSLPIRYPYQNTVVHCNEEVWTYQGRPLPHTIPPHHPHPLAQQLLRGQGNHVPAVKKFSPTADSTDWLETHQDFGHPQWVNAAGNHGRFLRVLSTPSGFEVFQFFLRSQKYYKQITHTD